MTIKNEVQGVVQALFGAFAGGYLPELTDEATNNGTSAMTARLVDVQGIILGKDMTSNQVFVDTILANMGVPSTNAAYDAAAGWAMNELANGATRADVVSAAVAFLTGIAAGTIVDSNYTAIATAFATKVEDGIEASEGDLAEEFSLATLQTEAGTISSFNLTAALDALSAANTAVSDNIEAWGEVNEVTAATSGSVYDAVFAAEAALASAGAVLALAIGAAANLDDTTNEAAGLATFSDYDSNDTAENLALSIAQSEMATQKLALDGALTSVVSVLAAADAAASTPVAAGTLKALVDTYLTQVKTVATATAAQVITANTVLSKAAAADVKLDVAFDTSTQDYTFGIILTSALIVDFAETTGSPLFGNYTATYDATTKVFAYALAGGATLSPAQVTADANLQALLANVDAKAVLDAIAADAAASASITAAEAARDDTLADIAAVDSTQVDATPTPNVLDADALAYSTATSNLTAFATAKTAFDEAVAEVVAARTDAAALADLEEAVADGITLIDTNGFKALNLVAAGVTPTTAKDVLIFLGETSAVNAGFSDSDLLKFDAGTYTLVEVDAADFLLGANAEAAGSATVLEIFVVDDGTDTILYVEENAFDGSTVAAQANAAAITLTGVTGEEFVLANNGYLTIA